MKDWYDLDLIPISRAARIHPELDMKVLMKNVVAGKTNLYLLVPQDCSVISYPGTEDCIQIPELAQLPRYRTGGPLVTKIWFSRELPTPEPTAVQIRSEKAIDIAKSTLYHLASQDFEDVDCTSISLFDDHFLDTSGSPVLIVEPPPFTEDTLTQLRESFPDIGQKYPEITKEGVFLRSTRVAVEFDELAVPSADILRLTGQTDAPEVPSSLEFDHPAKDPKHPGYPPELHAALEAWEAIYGDGKKPPKSTTPLIKQWLTDNWSHLGTNAKRRIAWVVNHAENKNSGTFDEK